MISARVFRISAIAFVLIIISASVSFGFTATAEIERTKMTIGETVQLTVGTSDSVSDLDADFSEIRDFDILSRSSSSMTQFINGKMSANTSIVVALSPKRAGNLKIPALKVTASGETAYTKQIVIEVAEDKSASVSGGKATGDIFAESRLSQKTIYQGQSVLYTFYLYFREQIVRPNLTLPDFADFSATEIKSPSSYTKTINGIPYNVLEKKVLLTPQKTGKFIFDPALLVYEASSGVRRDVFGFPEAVLQRRSLRSEAVTVEVKAMPPAPKDFVNSGFVGNLSVRMNMEQKELKTGDSGTLSIEFEGTGGRVGDIGKPEVKIPDSFKVYPDEPELKEDAGAEGFSGKKTFKIALVPTKAGEFTIKPVKISYFDSTLGEYKTIETDPVVIRVAEGENAKINSHEAKSDAKQENSKSTPSVSANDIFHIKTSLDILDHHSEISLMWFIVFLLSPPAAFLVFVLAARLNSSRKTLPAKLKTESLTAFKKLSETVSNDEFLSLLHKALSYAAASKTDCVHESLTSSDIRSKMKKAGFSDEIVNEFSMIFEEIEMQRFSGIDLTSDKMLQLRESAEKLVRRVL
ncbi:BatD family protein [Desulforegula conservatrix]|uniref:BatD family protein n=1 Tax=Desulforegula conservatrix TaxID=153026 RepID=UPI0004275D11|nr:BatD family protein [Desulforegula conservatrix]